MKTLNGRIDSIKKKRDEQMEMLEKWSRYQNFQMDYGIDPWEISRILLKPVGREESKIVYDSYVTTKDGTERVFRGVNVKEILDGEDSSEFTRPRIHVRWK